MEKNAASERKWKWWKIEVRGRGVARSTERRFPLMVSERVEEIVSASAVAHFRLIKVASPSIF